MATSSLSSATAETNGPQTRAATLAAESAANDHGVTVRPPEKDRIKTPLQFKTELEQLMETNKRHKEKLEECKKLAQEMKVLRTRVLPFMLNNLKQTRVNCSKHQMYLSSTVVQRKRKVQMNDLYEIIERELGAENRKLIKAKAEELAKQKVAMRQTRIMPIALKRAEKRKHKADNAKAASLASAAAVATDSATTTATSATTAASDSANAPLKKQKK